MRDTVAEVGRIRALIESGRGEQARMAAARLLERAPKDVGANCAMANALLQLGRAAQALHFARRAAEIRPDDAGALTLLGGVLVKLQSFDEAASAFAQAVERDPDDLQKRFLELTPLMLANRFSEAAARCRAGLERFPDQAKLTSKLAFALRYVGRVEEASKIMERAVAGYPKSRGLTIDLAAMMSYDPDADPRRVCEVHRSAARMVRAEDATLAEYTGVQRSRPGPALSAADAERPIRVGLLSSDLRQHSVAYFAEPIIRGLDRERFPLTCYFSGAADDVTMRLRQAAPAWRDVRGVGADRLADLIRSDAVDILIELNGLTLGDQMSLLLRRPAPVQVTYIGYPSTTGLEEVDFRIVDSLTDPPGTEEHCVERLIRLDPCFLCYRAGAETPAILDAEGGVKPRSARPITFGSFNALPKMNGRVIALWKRVLDAAPDARLIVKNRSLAEQSTRDDFMARFAEAEVDNARVTLLGPEKGLTEHLNWYSEIDVALDTFPYAGTTTTCEALLMGVPVVTLVGRSHAGRVGLSLLDAIGARQWCAEDESEYVRIATGLALASEERDGAWRDGLRQRMLASPLCDEQAYAARLQASLRAIWRERCRVGASSRERPSNQ